MKEKMNESKQRLYRDTMVGDLRDTALDWIKTFDKPWAKMPQAEQQTVIDSVTRQAIALVAKAVDIIVADERPSIPARIESVTIKDGLKVVLSCSAREANLVALGTHQGSHVYIVVADAEAYGGEAGPAKPDPDQRDLIPSNGDTDAN